MFFIGIDLGASFIKGGVLDLEKLAVRHIHREPFPGFLPGLPPTWREIDPYIIISSVRSMLDRLMVYAPDGAGLVFCGQMHGLILTDIHGKPLSNFISWQDKRALRPHPRGGRTFFAALTERISETEKRRMGKELRPGLPLCTLFCLAEEQALPHGDVFPVALADFVAAHLCCATPRSDLTNAAAHGALNLESLDWHDTQLAELGLLGLHWPELTRLNEPIGQFTVGNKPVTCYPSVGDQQCALIGSLLNLKELSLNIATGSQVSLLSPHLEWGEYQSRPFFDGMWLKTITHIPAGRSLNAIIRLLSELPQVHHLPLPDPWPYIEQSVTAVSATDLRANLAFFASACGERGELANLNEENLTVGHIFRAAFQNMADTYLSCARRLSPEQDWWQLAFSGGLARKSTVLRDIILAGFQTPYRFAPMEEETLLGLLALALAITGQSPSVMAAVDQLRLLSQQGHAWL